MKALVIVDVQKDFCPGGSLATVRGDEVAGRIAAYVDAHSSEYTAVVATRDWHIDPGDHFSDTPDFVDSWPVHCVKDSEGAAFNERIDARVFHEVFNKGAYEAAYSGFEGVADSDEKTGLADWLRSRDISDLDVVGIATDHCVRATVLDALSAGFTVRVLSSMCSAVGEDTGDAAFEEMHTHGAELV